MNEFDDYHERMVRRENQRKTELMEQSVREHLEPSLEDFDDSPAHQSFIEGDKRYVARRQRSLESRKPYQALAIEHLIQFGIGRGRLLSDPKDYRYYAEPIWPTRFDDISNRVDAAFFLHSLAEGNASRQDFNCPVALDITTSPDENVIREKILLSSNDTDLGYHVGFTDIRYCRDTAGERTHQTLVPNIASAWIKHPSIISLNILPCQKTAPPTTIEVPPLLLHSKSSTRSQNKTSSS